MHVTYLKKEEVKLNVNNKNVYIYFKLPIQDPYSDSPIKLRKNAGISEMSDFYNNSGVNKSCQNQVTASIFCLVAPFNPKTVSSNKNKLINPDNTIDGILNQFGGKFFKFKSKEQIALDDYNPFNVFKWISSYFDSIVESTEFES